MNAPTWTARLTRMLIDAFRELLLEEQEQFAERVAMDLDGGMGSLAIAAIAACAPGPRRELELAIWAKRFADDERQAMALGLRRDMTPEQLQALRDLASRLVREHGWEPVSAS